MNVYMYHTSTLTPTPAAYIICMYLCCTWYQCTCLGEIEVWESEDDLDCFEVSGEHDTNSQSRAYVLTVWFINLLALLQRKHFIPDAAISLLLKLLLIFLTLLSQLYPNVSEIVEVFPKSFYQMQIFLGINQTSFIHYVCCQKCSRIY